MNDAKEKRMRGMETNEESVKADIKRDEM